MILILVLSLDIMDLNGFQGVDYNG